MRKTWLVAMTEYSNAVRSKAFIIGVLALPVLLCLSIGLQYFGRKNVDVRDRRFAVVDRTGVLFPVIAAKAAELAAVAAENAGPVAHKAANVTGSVGDKLAARSKDLAADLRRAAEAARQAQAADVAAPEDAPADSGTDDAPTA